MKRLLLIHRLWGLSFGLFFGTLFIEKPLWFLIPVSVSIVYFTLFGDSHFNKGKRK